jgi:hypothetical protein
MTATGRQSTQRIVSAVRSARFAPCLILSLFQGIFGCGGATSSEPQATLAGASSAVASGGIGGGGTSGEAGAVTSGEMGGASSVAGGGGAQSMLGGAAGEAAVDSAAVSARPKSGTRFCLYDADCNGLTCTASMGRVQDACLARCASDLDCKPTERCFSQPSIPTSCFQRCVSPEDCDDQFDCADYYRTGEYTCLPSDWVRYWAPVTP